MTMEEFISLFDVHRSVLVQKIDIEHGLLNVLISNSILTNEHVESIKAQKTAREKNEYLLDILKKRDHSKVLDFIGILGRKQKDLGDLFNKYTDFSKDNTILPKRKLVRCTGEIFDETLNQHPETFLENENLKLKLQVNELKKKLEDVNIELNEKSDQNSKLLLKLETKNDLEENLNCINLELQDAKKQCKLLTDNLCRSEDEVKRLKHEMGLSIKRNSELEIFLERKNEEKRKLELKIIEIEEKYPKSVKEIKQTGNNIQVRGSSVIMGLAMLNNRIYIVCLKMKKLFVFSDTPPYDQIFSEEFEIQELNNPRDIVSSEKDKQLFISDDDCEKNHKIWHLSLVSKSHILERSQTYLPNAQKENFVRHQSLDLPDNPESIYKVAKTSIDRKPSKMFTCSVEDKVIGTLLVVLVSEFVAKTREEDFDREEYLVYIYKINEMRLLRKVIFDSNLGEITHVIIQPQTLKNSKSVNFNNLFEASSGDDPLSQGSFIVSHKSITSTQHGETKTIWLITKLSWDGLTVLNSFSPSVVDGVSITRPEYLTLMEACRILVADHENNRLVILGPKLGGSQVLVRNDNKCSCDKPTRVVCHLNKKMIVVSHWGRKGVFSVFTH